VLYLRKRPPTSPRIGPTEPVQYPRYRYSRTLTRATRQHACARIPRLATGSAPHDLKRASDNSPGQCARSSLLLRPNSIHRMSHPSFRICRSRDSPCQSSDFTGGLRDSVQAKQVRLQPDTTLHSGLGLPQRFQEFSIVAKENWSQLPPPSTLHRS
jgi:hypothetical protein